MSEENKALMRRVLGEILNAGNMAVVDEVYSGDVLFRTSGAPDIQGTEGVKRIMTAHRTAFPDGLFAVEEMIAEGDRVATCWTFEGTHKSEWRGVAPTGRKVLLRGTSTQRVSGGKIVEDSSVYDALDTMQQLGAVTDPVVTEANKALFTRLFDEFLNSNKQEVVGQIIASDSVHRIAQTPEIRGCEGYRQHVAAFRTGVPDVHFTIEHMIAEGDRIAIRFTMTGTHTREWSGIAPTGKRFTATGTATCRIAGGKIVEELTEWDALGVFQQLGAVPPLAQPMAQTAG